MSKLLARILVNGAGIHGPKDEQDLQIMEQTYLKLKPPSMFKVVLINDDYTPMDFVIEVLLRFFHHNEEQATQIMLSVHTQGKGVCGIYTRDVAETKAIKTEKTANKLRFSSGFIEEIINNPNKTANCVLSIHALLLPSNLDKRGKESLSTIGAHKNLIA